MIALIWKELRENLKWALLAMVGLGGAELYGLYQTQHGQPDYFSYPIMGGITLTKVSFLLVTTFGPAAIGFLLGLVQILPELKADRWAALLHRPVPRGRIFWGKAAAGVLLYLIAAAPPFLLCLGLVATPGHVAAPFVPGLALPGTADTFTGLVYYFAALAVALQRGGWVVLRGLPLLAALHASFFVVTCSAFGDAIGAAALMMIALCVAAWGAMHHQWSFGARPWLGKMAFFAVAFYGLCGVADLVGTIFDTADADSSTFTNYQLTQEGIPLRMHYVNGIVVSVQNLDGSEPQNPDYKPDRVRNHITYLNSASSYIGDPHERKHAEYQPPYRQSYTYMAAVHPFRYPHMEQWFYLREERTAIGMLPLKKVPIQRLDARGFQPPSAKPVPFAPDVEVLTIGNDSFCLFDRKSIRFANLAERKITDVALPFPGEIFGATTAWARDNGKSIQATAVALSTAMAFYDNKDGSLLTTLPYHRDMDRWGAVAAGLNGAKNRFYLWYRPSIWISREERKGMPSYIDEMNLQGKVLHSYTLPPLAEPPKRIPPLEYLDRRLQSPAFFFGTLLYQKAGAALGNLRLQEALDWRLNEDGPRTREIAVHIPVFSAFFAGITLFWARRVHFSWRRAGSWAALVLLFNLAGFLVFRLLADWPRLVSCAACRQPRPIDEESCPACGDGWPRFQPNGTEIFDHPAEHLNGSATPA